MLLLLMGAALIAAPAMVMALIADPSGNILPASWTSQGNKADIADPSGNPRSKPDGNTSPAPAIQGDQSDIADPSANALPVQTIQSNKADYAPGATVTLTGSNWQPGEYVRIDVNDDQGKTWSRNVDVRADASGRIQDRFQLPEWFVATYEVTAMGTQSGVATTSFTEGNVSFGSTSPAPASGNITNLIADFESAKQAPDAQPQPIVSTDEDAAKKITLSGTDEDGDKLNFFIVTAPNHGTLGPLGELTCAGTAPRTCSANVTYTPDDDYNGFDIFSFKADDGTQGSYPAPVSMLVDPVNDTPVTTDDAKTMSEDGGPLSIDFGALLSDVETSDANLAYDITNPPDPAKGSLGGTGATRNFTPAANFNGTVNIDYTLADRGDPDNCSAANPPCAAAETSAQKTMTVTVDAVNDAPGFQMGSDQTVNEDAGTQTVDGWATAITAGPNESNQTVDFQLTNDNNGLFAAGGQPSVAPNGTLTYTPADNANGAATVKIKATDSDGTANGGQDEGAEQTFTITVDAVNDAPVAQADTKTTDEDTKLVFPSSDLVGNDDEGADNESGQTLTVTEVYDGNHATVDLKAGNITLTPETDFSGDATFTYRVCDNGSPSECSVQKATVNVAVNAINDAPVADNKSVTTDEDTAKEIILSASDVEGDALGYSIVGAPQHGTLSGKGANLTYTPDNDDNGPDRFTFEANDGTAGSDPATVSIAVNAVNDAPVANEDTRSTNQDTPLVFAARQLLGNDDPGPANESGQTLTVTAVDQALNGQVSLGTNGDITFSPDAGFNGQASFEYTVCDNGSPGECSEMLVIVNVTMSPVNDAPTFTAGANQTVAEDSGTHSIPGWASGISAGPTDESDQQLTFEVTNNTNPDLFSTQPSVAANGTLSYTPAANANGSAAVTVRLEDNGGIANGGVDTSAEQTFVINVTAVNDAPIVSNLQGDAAANEGEVKTYTFDIADVDSSTFSASVNCGGAGKGELVAGSVQISGTNGEFGCKFLDGRALPTPVDISVQLSDGDTLSNVESKSVSVSNVAPALTGVSSSSQNALAGTDNPVTFTGTATDVSPIDFAAGFRWRWAIDGGAFGPFGAVDANTFNVGGANNLLYFSTCGTHTVEAQPSDKDGGVSAESLQATQSVSVYDGAFDPPLVDGSTNMVQKGQIVPVKISIGCGTTNLTNLTPHIQLLSGNVSPEIESGSTTVTTTPVSAADTTQTMRPVDGGYIYNLQVPSNAAANEEFTILVNPFGATADHAATGMYVVIKIRE